MLGYLECIMYSGLFEGIPQRNYLDALEQLGIREKSFHKDAFVFHEGDHIKDICIVKEGSVRTEKISVDGGLDIVEIYEKGSMFGLDVAMSRFGTAPVDYISNESTTVIVIPVGTIRNSSYSRNILDVIMERLADDNIRKMNKIEILAKKGLRDRVMTYLGVLQKKSGTDTVTIKLNREQMARYLCVNRSALSNELSKMKKEGILEIHGNEYKLLNRQH